MPSQRFGIGGKVAFASALWCAIHLVVIGAHAQQSDRMGEDADRMFQAGRAFLADGEIQRACEAFAKSYELRPRNGTLLNLAVCLEQRGDAVAAFHRFQQSLAAAINDGRADREQLARTHIAALTKKLAWLSIQVDDEAALADLRISCDGVAIAAPTGNATALEPGTHVVTANAPGRSSFEASITIAAGTTEVLRIPVLAPTETSPPEPPAALDPPIASAAAVAPNPPVTLLAVQQEQPWRTPLTASLLAVGVGALSMGAICGARAMADGDEIERLCGAGRCTTDASWAMSQRLEARARTEARLADVALPLGAVALAAGAYLLWTKPRARHEGPTSKLHLAPTASPHALGTSLRGTW